MHIIFSCYWSEENACWFKEKVFQFNLVKACIIHHPRKDCDFPNPCTSISRLKLRTWWNSECSIFRQNRVLFEIWYSMVDFSELLRVVPYFHVKMSTMLQILMMIITKLGIPLRNLIFWEGVIFTSWQAGGGDGILIRILNWKFEMHVDPLSYIFSLVI